MDEIQYRYFEVTTQVGEAKLKVTQAVLDEVMSDEWQENFYTFREENDAVRALASWAYQWPGTIGGNYSVDGIAHLTAEDMSLVQDDISINDLFDEAEVAEVTVTT